MATCVNTRWWLSLDDVCAALCSCRWVNAFAVMAHAFWGTWALIQARHSPIDFDFLTYSKDRFGGYRTHRERFIDGVL